MCLPAVGRLRLPIETGFMWLVGRALSWLSSPTWLHKNRLSSCLGNGEDVHLSRLLIEKH
jgi:hypothetical protein